MKLDLNKPVQTRDGRKARIICTDAKGAHPIIALIEGDPYEEVYHYLNNGTSSNEATGYNLINIPEEKELWVNVYPDPSAVAYINKQNADINAENSRIARIKVTYKEGQFDE